MRAALGWQDYELLDATGGFRLERWGGVLLQRPDPQVIWNTPRQTDAWDRVDALYHRSEKGGGSWEYRRTLPERWQISYPLASAESTPLRLTVSPTGFKHTGIFPEQAVNWEEYARLVRNAGRPLRVLNLFGYTGGATLACAAAGAQVSHVDASKGMVSWARDNATSSSLDNCPVRWLVDDCAKFVAREARRGSLYDAIIMDPPSYGRGPGGEVWKLEEALYPLLAACVEVLREDAVFFAISSYTSGLAPSVAGYMLDALLTRKRGGHTESDEIGLPVTSGGVVPCGSTSIWYAG